VIVVWSPERTRYEAITSYLERNIPKESRWRWDPQLRRWYALSDDIARRLARYAQGAAAVRLAGLSPEEKSALAASAARDSDIEIPSPSGLEYLPYQRAGIAAILSIFGDLPRSPRLGQEGGFTPSRRGVLLADEMG
jgi:hypothetical protein